MALYTGKIEWHDLRIAPDDLPGTEEPILVTIETLGGERRTWVDVYLKETYDDRAMFVTRCPDEYGRIEETAVWYPVIAWAYPPDPFEYY